MMYGIIAVALIFVFANLPQYIRKQLTEKIADESSKAKENLQTSQLNFLTKIEWLKFYPLKKILLGVIWLVCLFYAVRGVFMTINDPRGVFIFLTVLFWLITIFTARKIWRYIKLSYHCVPVLNHIKTKEELKESLQGECFEKVLFEHNILRKYFPVLISENWVVMNGRLFPRHGVEKIYYLHESPVWNYEQIRFIYSNGEEYLTPSDRQTVDQHIIIWHFRRIKLCRNNAGIFHPRTPGILVITVIEKIITVITRLKMGYFNFPDSANYGIK